MSFAVVGIGASAGGIEAVTNLMRALPADTGMAFVLVQHLDPTHESLLTEILSRATAMPVTEVSARMAVEPNHVYVIPPAHDLIVSRGELHPSRRTEARGTHRAIDIFLRSLAEDQGHQAIGVILSGSATDGTLGLEEIKAAGGITFAQDDTAMHDSMPHSAVATGCVDFVLPPDEIAREIGRIARHPYVAGASDDQSEFLMPQLNIGPVLEQLRRGTGVDFSNYKRTTLFRRITRRMLLRKTDRLQQYVDLLNDNPAEIDALFADVLINVTSFFRNPETFEALKSDVFPELTKNRSRHDPLRLWVLGCSTGEEAYSLAIAFSEFMEAANRQIPLQVFGTDLNGNGIEKARAGVYSRNVVRDVSPERLRRYFVEDEGGYRIRKSIRDICVFARHNVLADPPFSRMDFVSCRNLLIYLGQEMQQRVIPILHYALQPGGYVWLGSSETVGNHRDLFELEVPRHKFYRKKTGKRRELPAPLALYGPGERHVATKAMTQRDVPIGGIDTQREAERVLLAKYAPPSVLVSGALEILQFRGDTGPFLAPAPGRASLNLLKMAREGLLVGLRAAVHKAQKDEAPVREENLRVKSNGGYREVHVEVIPVRAASEPAGCLLVLFEEAASTLRAPTGQLEKMFTTVEEQSRSDRELNHVRQELAATREYLQSVIEQQEAANEELQAANEEIQSSNEELQSINEELETSKEEVQSTNEELATVNEELQVRNQELAQSNNDLLNLLASVEMAIVMVGSDLRIRSLTPAAEKMLNLIRADVGRPIKDLKLNIAIPEFERQLEAVIDTVTVREFEIRNQEDKWYLVRLRPYRTHENRIEGVVIVFIDIDSLKRDQDTLHRQAELLEHANEPTLMWELGGPIVYWNKAAERLYGYTREEALDRRGHELLASTPGPQDIDDALRKQGWWAGKMIHTLRDRTQIAVHSRMVMLRERDGKSFVIAADQPMPRDSH